MSDMAWEEEWAALVAEREAARERWQVGAAELAVKARDPLGLKKLTRKYPFIVTGVAAGVGALLAGLLSSHRGPAPAESRETPADQPTMWGSLLRNAAVSFVAPMVQNFVAEKMAQFLDPEGAEETIDDDGVATPV